MQRGGKIRILATAGTSAQRAAARGADLRRVRLQGHRGQRLVRACTRRPRPHAATVQQLNAAVNKALATPELRERFAKLGLEPTGGSAADLAALMKRDTERWAPVVKASGFKGD